MTKWVLSISGPPGSGKTTLAREVAARTGALFLGWDDYETFTRRSPDRVADWLARGAPFDEVEAPGLAAAIRAAEGPVVIDSPFGKAHPEFGTLIDTGVWIDCAPDLALSRKIAQLAASVPEAQASGFLNWLSGYLAAYARIVRPSIVVQEVQVAPTCALRVSGDSPPTDSARIIMQEPKLT